MCLTAPPQWVHIFPGLPHCLFLQLLLLTLKKKKKILTQTKHLACPEIWSHQHWAASHKSELTEQSRGRESGWCDHHMNSIIQQEASVDAHVRALCWRLDCGTGWHTPPPTPKSCTAQTVWARVTTFIYHVDVWTLWHCVCLFHRVSSTQRRTKWQILMGVGETGNSGQQCEAKGCWGHDLLQCYGAVTHAHEKRPSKKKGGGGRQTSMCFMFQMFMCAEFHS